MDSLIQNFVTYLLIAMIVVVVISQFQRLVGAILGLVLWTAVALVGTEVYARGGAVGIANIRLPQPVFYGLCGAMVLFASVIPAYIYLRKKNMKASYEE